MEYALSSLVKRVSNAKRRRLQETFTELKKLSRFTEFELNSKKIFYKIGFATLMVLGQKINYKNYEIGFNGIFEKAVEEEFS